LKRLFTRVSSVLLFAIAAWFFLRTVGRADPVQLKTWKDGDALTAAELNANFVALQSVSSQVGPQGPPGATYAWNAFNAAPFPYAKIQTDGHIARLVFTAPSAGYVYASAQFVLGIRNKFDSSPVDCLAESAIGMAPGIVGCISDQDCKLAGYVRFFVNANLPTELASGTYLGVPHSVSTVIPVNAGANTIYLNGRTDCAEVFYSSITMNAVFVQNNPVATVSIP